MWATGFPLNCYHHGDAIGSLGTSARGSFCILTASRLHLYSYGVALIYATALIHFYWNGAWIVDQSGAPLYGDFTTMWAAGWQALNAEAAQLYDSNKFVGIQKALLGARDYFYPNFPYPPTFFLILAPLSTLPYPYSFLTWDVATLLGCLVVVYLIVRRPPAIALLLASPFTAWNFLAGQNGFLTASLLGASLFFLEERPIVAGVIIGCLTYKPQFGILLPVALVALRQWRTCVSAMLTTGLLACATAAAFGTAVWEVFPRGLAAQVDEVLLASGDAPNWGYLQTVYGLMRILTGRATAAWLAQGIIAVTLATMVWFVWRSRIRFGLKAAMLSAATLIATPYALRPTPSPTTWLRLRFRSPFSPKIRSVTECLGASKRS
jgi:arabinofuranan 3-O-arabinosyltransferase